MDPSDVQTAFCHPGPDPPDERCERRRAERRPHLHERRARKPERLRCRAAQAVGLRPDPEHRLRTGERPQPVRVEVLRNEELDVQPRERPGVRRRGERERQEEPAHPEVRLAGATHRYPQRKKYWTVLTATQNPVKYPATRNQAWRSGESLNVSSSSPRTTKQVRANVAYFPIRDGAAGRSSPFLLTTSAPRAIEPSRNATRSSIHSGASPSTKSMISAAPVSSLSASGSRNAPRGVCCPSRRASSPSSASVNAATRNTTRAHPGRPKRWSSTNAGTASSRRYVNRFGTVHASAATGSTD